MFGTRTEINLDIVNWEDHLISHIKRGTIVPSEADEKVSLTFDCFRIIFPKEFTYKTSSWKNIRFIFKIYKNGNHFDVKKYIDNFGLKPEWVKVVMFNYVSSMNLEFFINMIQDLKRLSKLEIYS